MEYLDVEHILAHVIPWSCRPFWKTSSGQKEYTKIIYSHMKFELDISNFAASYRDPYNNNG